MSIVYGKVIRNITKNGRQILPAVYRTPFKILAGSIEAITITAPGAYVIGNDVDMYRVAGYGCVSACKTVNITAEICICFSAA
jgi:hypothetical protein